MILDPKYQLLQWIEHDKTYHTYLSVETGPNCLIIVKRRKSKERYTASNKEKNQSSNEVKRKR